MTFGVDSDLNIFIKPELLEEHWVRIGWLLRSTSKGFFKLSFPILFWLIQRLVDNAFGLKASSWMLLNAAVCYCLTLFKIEVLR